MTQASFLRLLTLPLALAALAGCAPSKQLMHEERYRLFFAKELQGQDIQNQKPEEIVAQFQPEAAIRRAIEDFAKQGYSLARVEPIPWGEGATLLTFRREFAATSEPDRAPTHFIGTYKLVDGKPDPTLYIFSQRKDGYRIHILGPESQRMVEAKWESRELVWRDDQGVNKIRLNPSARVMTHVIETAEGFDVPREYKLISADREIPHQKPAPEDVRASRAFLAKLKPATPRWYDPYPW